MPARGFSGATVGMPGGGGAVHMPGNMGASAAHIPGGVDGGRSYGNPGLGGSSYGGQSGVHVPSGLNAGRVHVPNAPSGEARNGAVVPGGAGYSAHVPSPRSEAGQAPTQHLAGPPSTHALGAANAGPHHGAGADKPGTRPEHPAAYRRGTGAGGTDIREAPSSKPGGRGEIPHVEHAVLKSPADVIGGRGARTTRFPPDIGQRRAEAGRFLHTDQQRDVAHDREFTASHKHDFHTTHVRDFTPREFAAWRGGHWRNEWHYGRRGWWWQVGGVWYGYAEPIFPFPEEVAPLDVYATAQVEGEDLEQYEMPPDALPDSPNPGGLPRIAALPAAPSGSYTCGDPDGPFPDVARCGQPWQFQPVQAQEATP